MTPERWQQIEKLYHSAREHGPGVLVETDPELRREVERLLAQDSDGKLLDRHALDLLDQFTDTDLEPVGRQRFAGASHRRDAQKQIRPTHPDRSPCRFGSSRVLQHGDGGIGDDYSTRTGAFLIAEVLGL